MLSLSPTCEASLVSLGIEVALFATIWGINWHDPYIYFNPQDFAESIKEKNTSKKLPQASGEATFEPLLKQYIVMAQFLVTIAAASISFGGLQVSDPGIYTAKLFLAFSIGFALFFCISATYFYESYLHDLTSYKPYKCAIVESFGVSALTCFVIGYCYWAMHMKPAAGRFN
jgi:hypothetical protein